MRQEPGIEYNNHFEHERQGDSASASNWVTYHAT